MLENKDFPIDFKEFQQPRDKKPRVCAVIVTYKPNIELLSSAVKAAAIQSSFLVVIDNSEKEEIYSAIEKHVKTEIKNGTFPEGRIYVMKNSSNLGLAKSYNIACGIAIEKKCDFLMLLDQDSILQDRAILKMLDTYAVLSKTRDIGGISARNIEPVRLKEEFFLGFYKRRGLESQTKYVEIFFAWNSGFMIPVGVLRAVGGFDEHYFLDSVDQEMCFKIHNLGKKIYLVNDAEIVHELGEIVDIHLLWMHGFGHRQSPFRYYYIGREGLRLVRSFFLKYPIYVTLVVLSILNNVIASVVFEKYPMNLKSLLHFFEGIVHYFKGVSGKRPLRPSLD